MSASCSGLLAICCMSQSVREPASERSPMAARGLSLTLWKACWDQSHEVTHIKIVKIFVISLVAKVWRVYI